ncbi:YibE/F [Geobacillus subterraneus]|mgnify:CR=1 FL=1|uniref:YibE/F n=2 Tax=Geobacillus TaxID=129337 RepID=A0ABN4NE35_9BACL|nr:MULTISPECIES: YibE/F family protein [Geobacillus]KZM53940.1 YibE/F [Geobacillus stearothermophilus]MED5074698.1 YibE/F family protein [Anoxybacillus geothermalis]AMX82672.1 YibE/F [Geobacillus subterraneus]KZS26246.1 YibE/F [Geobacillus subterraneus]OXB90764.1 YibE/F [Geobacillus uzenensis]
MNTLFWLGTILFILMVLVGGKKGARSFLAIFFNFGVLILTILIMLIPKADPIILTLIASTLISCISLFYINGVSTKTITAFISSIATVVILLFFIVIVTENAMIQGFGEEEAEGISAFSLYIGIDFVKIGASVIIMSTIGAITDTAIAISSPMREIFHHHPSISRKDLFAFGLRMGRDLLGTSTNTLFFAFFGSYLALLIWFKDLSYSIDQIVNSKIFSAEMIAIFFAGIGVASTIPITSWVTAYFLVKKGRK